MYLGGGSFTISHEWEATQSILHHQRDDLEEVKLPNPSMAEYLEYMLVGIGGRSRADWCGVENCWKHAGSMSAHERFLVLRAGFIRTDPTEVRPGDEVWALEGGVMPFIGGSVKETETEKCTGEHGA